MKKFIKTGLILTGVLALFLLAGCSSKKENLDISNCIENRVSGFDGYAKFDGKVDYKKLMQIPTFQNKLTPEMLKGDYKVKLVADKTTDLKNGDKIKLRLDYNKEIYKRDFGVELTFEPKEIEVKDLKNLIKNESDLTKEQWNKIDKNANYVANKYFKDNGDKDSKILCKIISLDKKDNSNKIDYWYEARALNGEKIYLEIHYYNNPTIDNNNIELNSSREWKYVNMNQSFNDIIKNFYSNRDYVIIEK